MTTMAKTKHTPGELHRSLGVFGVIVDNDNAEDGGFDGEELANEDGLVICRISASKANGNRIVHTWNCHDDLLDACKKARDLIEALMPGVANIALQDYRALNETPIAINEAIAKAEKS